MASFDRKINHSWSSSDIGLPGLGQDGANRSGQGIAVPAIATTNDKHRLGDLPRPPFKTGNAGSPSSSMSTTASQMQQIVFTDEDKEDYRKNKSKPTWDTDRAYIQDSVIRGMIRLVLEKEKMTDEMSGASGVAGVVLPLGKSPDNFDRPKKKRRPPAKVAGSTFGNAKPVNEKKMKIRISELRQIIQEELKDDNKNSPPADPWANLSPEKRAERVSKHREKKAKDLPTEELDETDLWNPDEDKDKKEAPRKSAAGIRGKPSY
mgnify:CR=1 FL=1